MSGNDASMFIGQCARNAPKPACISAHSERARARAFGAVGHSASAEYFSARYSAIARVSHTAKPSSSTSTGTRAAGVTRCSSRLKRDSGVKASNSSCFSSNSMPVWRISTHGRMDHDE